MIQLFCPSRGRPEAAKALLDSFLATKRLPDTELVFCIDKDDPYRKDYPTSLVLGEPTGDPTGPLNRAATGSQAAIVGFIGDDSRCETEGWDVMVASALRSPGFCWGDDGHDSPWPSTIFVSREIIQSLGYMVPPVFRRGFFDRFWVDLSMDTGTGHVIPAMFRHTNLPPGHPDGPSAETIAADERAYWHWREIQRKADARAVVDANLAVFF